MIGKREGIVFSGLVTTVAHTKTIWVWGKRSRKEKAFLQARAVVIGEERIGSLKLWSVAELAP